MATRLATLVSLAKNCWESCSKPAPRSHSSSSRMLARSFTPCDQWKQPREEPVGHSTGWAMEPPHSARERRIGLPYRTNPHICPHINVPSGCDSVAEPCLAVIVAGARRLP